MTAPPEGTTAPVPASEPSAPSPLPAPAPAPRAVTQSPLPPTTGVAGEACPSCGVPMATDQRYCLECGHRRGDPRLPFMDAVVFMDAVKRPRQASSPPPSRKRPRVSANASLIAGIGTLLLAMGIGVLIGKSGEGGSSTAANNTPQVITVNGGGGETASTATTGGGNGKSSGTKSGGTKSGKSGKSEKLATDSSGTSAAAAEVLKPSGDVKLPPPEQKVGGECEAGTAGCSNGKFEGNFFGE